MLDKLRDINENILRENINNKDIYDKHIIIKKLLSDDKCFFKINIEEAYALLRELNIQEDEIKRIYLELIDSSNF